MKENLQLTLPKRGKGIIFSFVIDTTNGGAYVNFSKHMWSFCFFYIAFRIYFMSEERYNAINAMATLNQMCTSHDLTFSKTEEEIK